MKYDYIPTKQVACIESGDGFLRIELKDGNVKYGWQYAKFGNVPTTRSELEDCYMKSLWNCIALGIITSMSLFMSMIELPRG